MEVKPHMKTIKVLVPWRGGIHMRPAAALVKLAQRSSSSILLRLGDRCADARNIIAILTLCASMGSVVNIEVTGADETDAADAAEQIFEAGAAYGNQVS